MGLQAGSLGGPFWGDRTENLWKGPTQGFQNRDPNLWLVLQTEFRGVVRADELAVHRLFAGLAELLGDHRVTIDLLAKESALPAEKDIAWKQSQHSLMLSCMCARLGDPAAWTRLAPMERSAWLVRAERGGGRFRHEVFRVEYSPSGHPNDPTTLLLALRTRHVASDDMMTLNAMVENLMIAIAAAAPLYAASDFVVRPHASQIDICSALEREVWRDTPDRAGRMPCLSRYMLLTPEHLQRLGGAEAFRAPWKGLQAPIFFREMGPCLLIKVSGISKFDLELRTDFRDSLRPFPNLWLLGQFSESRILATHDMGWAVAWLKDALRLQAEQRTRKRSMPESKAIHPLVASKVLRRHPPSFLAGRVRPAESVGDSCSVAFDLFGEGLSGKPDNAAWTVYGEPGPDGTLQGRLLVGSPREERAHVVFDPLRDGYDGAIAEQSSLPREKRATRQFRCPRCDGRLFRLRATLTYSDDLLETLDAKQRERVWDFFDWFQLAGMCVACQWKGFVADIECA